MKIIIESIAEWKKDDAKIAGDRDHGRLSESDVLLSLARETKDKKESKWTKGLPFVWESDVELDIDAIADVGKDIRELMDDALTDDALTQYSDQYCADDYLKPVRFEGRIVA